MPYAVYVPRVNNNDDEVRITDVLVKAGDQLATGQAVAEVETDKATLTVEADQPGYVLQVAFQAGQSAKVGSVLVWLGASPNEPIPHDPTTPSVASDPLQPLPPTAKARALIKKLGLDPGEISHEGERITIADVEQHVAQSKAMQPKQAASPSLLPAAAGRLTPLSSQERGMARSVLWHRDEAAAAYLETEYDCDTWAEYAGHFKNQHRLLGDPLLPLMAYRLANIVADHPRANSSIVGEQRFVYNQVNLGVTIQVEDTLYLVTIPGVEQLLPKDFLTAFGKLHRRALAKKLEASDVSGATVAFSSMARWQVSRHIPILPPHVSLIVAHTVSQLGNGILGASYDHRVLSGADTIGILSRLASPPDDEPTFQESQQV